MSPQVSQWTGIAAAVGLAGLLALGAEPTVRADAPPAPQDAASGASDARLGASLGPAFLENRGQWPEGTLFVARGGGRGVRVERDALLLELWREGGGELVRLTFEGTSAGCAAIGQGEQSGLHHYFLGKDPSRWVRGVRRFSGVRWRSLYPGIDLELRWQDGELKYDLLVAPGADLGAFVVRAEGILGMQAGEGSLRLETGGGALEQTVGSTWQVEDSGERTPLACRFVALDGERFGLAVDGWDRRLPLVIDPALVWSTYLGSPASNVGDRAYAVAVDPTTRDVIVAGNTEGPGFPMTPGTFQSPGLQQDCFVARLRASDGALVYSSVFGGASNQERAWDVAVDHLGQPTIVGESDSRDFPTTAAAYDASLDGVQGSGFAIRLGTAGDQVLFSTILEAGSGLAAGGTTPFAVAVATTGSTLVGGKTSGPWTPSPGAPDKTVEVTEGFLLRLDPTASSLEWFTFLGGNSLDQVHDLVLDENDDLAVTGRTSSPDFPTTPGTFQPDWVGSVNASNAFVTRVSADGTTLLWSSLLGGAGAAQEDEGHAVGIDALGCVYVGGWTKSDKFPTTRNALRTTWYFNPMYPDPTDGFVTRFSPDGSRLIYSTYLGNSGTDWIRAMAVDPSGVATVAGPGGIDHPITAGAWLENSIGGDFKISRLDPSGGRLLYSTYFGGPSNDQVEAIARSPQGRVALCGASFGPGYPTTPGSASPAYNGGQSDATVTSFELVLTGVDLLGSSTPTCLGPLNANATEMPAAGSGGFGFYCSAAPPLASGWLLVGKPATAPVTVLGAEVWIDLTKPWRRRPVHADPAGWVEAVAPLTHVPLGASFAAQLLFVNPTTCQGAGTLSASNAVTILVQ